MQSSHIFRVSAFIDQLSQWIGKAVSWLVLAMVLVIVYDVSMRFIFKIGSVALQELEWHMFAVLFLLGAAYTLKEDGHVRVDVLYQSRHFSDRVRAGINVFGCLFFLIPFCLLIITSTWPFIVTAFEINEGSPDPGGLPFRYLLKVMIPVGFFLLMLQGISQLLRNIAQLLRGPVHNDPEGGEA